MLVAVQIALCRPNMRLSKHTVYSYIMIIIRTSSNIDFDIKYIVYLSGAKHDDDKNDKTDIVCYNTCSILLVLLQHHIQIYKE